MRLNEEVLSSLLQRALEIENNNSQILLKYFISEENSRRREMIYTILKECEYSKSLLKEWIKELKGKIPLETQIRDLHFENMYIKEKLNFLRRVCEVIKDYYSFLMNDLKKIEPGTVIENEKIEKLLRDIEKLIKAKEKHLKMIDEIWEFS